MSRPSGHAALSRGVPFLHPQNRKTDFKEARLQMKTDIEIAQACTMLPITQVAEELGVSQEILEPYGRYKAKLDPAALSALPRKGRLILVTAINPTPAGEGKTTTSVGLADALHRLGKKAVLALREPSLGPVFGIKGGAAGGGYAQVVPMEDINLHFTGDFHAIGAANNLLSAMLDNHIQQGNALDIDVRKITWKRCVDMNDRQLRNIVCGLGGKVNGTMEELLKLPGVGRKTANLILGDVFKAPGAVVVDTHCIRLSNRMGLVDNQKDPAKIEPLLRAQLPPEKSSDFCHRLVLHGRAVCTARSPECGRCCVRHVCQTGSGQ